jgi:flagellar hook-basal body complex protein FliE
MVDIVNPAAAANAYANTAKAASLSDDIQKGPSFGEVLKNSALDAIRTMRAGESASARAITGEATLPEVVQAVTSAELTLQTVVSVRDRLVSAYQEIMRMPI